MRWRFFQLWCATVGLLMAGDLALAEPLRFPGTAALVTQTVRPDTDHWVATGAWTDGNVPGAYFEGQVTQQAWQIRPTSQTTLQMLRPFKEQLVNAGFATLFECQTKACGGFDFRFALSTLPPPELQINLADFRYLAVQRDGEVMTLLVSRSGTVGFVELTQILQGADDGDPLALAVTAPQAAIDPMDVVASLAVNGRAILSDLEFAIGSAQLDDRPYPSLRALADYLFDFPQINVALVGHTDADGPLDANVILSRRRAASVLERLTSDYGVARERLEAQGMGYLAPIGSNLTEEGRARNRRVEVIVTTTQ